MTTEKPAHWRFRDLEGKRFGRLTVTSYAGKKGRLNRWNTLCDCGGERIVQSGNLVTGNTKSCGCLCREMVSQARRKHGESGNAESGRTPEYTAWAAIRRRCENPNDGSFSRYGGRGISVCDRWRLSFEDFLEDMGRRPSEFHSIDRIDNSGNYEPSNCRWATDKEQSRNRRSNRVLEYNGEKKCLTEWAEEMNVNSKAIEARLKRGWSVGKSLTTPVRGMRRKSKTNEQ